MRSASKPEASSASSYFLPLFSQVFPPMKLLLWCTSLKTFKSSSVYSNFQVIMAELFSTSPFTLTLILFRFGSNYCRRAAAFSLGTRSFWVLRPARLAQHQHCSNCSCSKIASLFILRCPAEVSEPVITLEIRELSARVWSFLTRSKFLVSQGLRSATLRHAMFHTQLKDRLSSGHLKSPRGLT